jgi:hypothetical protein
VTRADMEIAASVITRVEREPFPIMVGSTDLIPSWCNKH